eukprot:15585-Heterococcus_DN1.PRE.1
MQCHQASCQSATSVSVATEELNDIYLRQSSTALAGATSTRLKTTINGRLPTHSGTNGCVVDTGIRASLTSITTSTSFRYCCSVRSARAMCPGKWPLLAMQLAEQAGDLQS